MSNFLRTLAALGLVASLPVLGQAPPPSASAAPGTPAQVQPAPVSLPVASSKATPKTHTVTKGESFPSIALKFGMTEKALRDANPALAKKGVWPGDVVNLDLIATASVTGTAPESTAPAAPSKGGNSKPVAVSPLVPASDAAPKPVKVLHIRKPKPERAERPERVMASEGSAPTRAAGKSEPVRLKRVELSPEPVKVIKETSETKDVLYSPDSIPVVNCEERNAVTIYLPDKEKITDVFAGDTELWLITPTPGRNVVMIKVTGPDLRNNLVVFTKSGNTYHIKLTSDPSKPYLQILRIHPPLTDSIDGIVRTPGGTWDLGDSDGRMGAQGGTSASGSTNPFLRGIPADRNGRLDPIAVAAAMERVREEDRLEMERSQREFMQAMLTGRTDEFEISYDWNTPFRVTHCFAASNVTYIRVAVPQGLQPLFYVIEDGKRTICPWTVSKYDSSVMMVDRLFKRAVVVLGKKEAKIENKGLAKAMAKVQAEAANG